MSVLTIAVDDVTERPSLWQRIDISSLWRRSAPERGGAMHEEADAIKRPLTFPRNHVEERTQEAFPMDLAAWRVYSAEQSIDQGASFESIDDARTFLWWIRSTKWWMTTFPDAPVISVELGGEARGGEFFSWARQIDETDEWLVVLHPLMLSTIVLLHEIAHCVSPRSYGNPALILDDNDHRRTFHSHSHMFTAALCALSDRYGTGTAGQLVDAYAHFEVPVATLDELQAARVNSVLVDAAQAEASAKAEMEFQTDERWASQRAAMAAHRAAVASGEIGAPRVPVFGWGEWLRSVRFRPRRSQRWIAEQVSPLISCSARDISRIERSHARPIDVRSQRIALAAAAVLNVDPVWAETSLGLAPSDGLFNVAKLALIAPEWTEQVRHLNGLLFARPNRWLAGGDR